MIESFFWVSLKNADPGSVSYFTITNSNVAASTSQKVPCRQSRIFLLLAVLRPAALRWARGSGSESHHVWALGALRTLLEATVECGMSSYRRIHTRFLMTTNILHTNRRPGTEERDELASLDWPLDVREKGHFQ